MEMENKITSGTVARTVIFALALINQILTSTGHSVIPIDDETITSVITLGFTIVASIIAWWKNNSFTKAAIEGDKIMKEIKTEIKAE